MEQITILSTISERERRILTKTIRLERGEIVIKPYDNGFLFDADTLDVDGIESLSEALTYLENQPHSCVIRGVPLGATRAIRRTLVDDPQKGAATIGANPAGVSWIMFDFDKLPVASLNLSTEAERLAYLLSELPPCFQDASFHYQWSSSAGLKGWDHLSAHLWFWLDEPWFCETHRERLQEGDWANVPVDAAPFSANQIHFTASPIFKGMSDPVESRSGFVRGARHSVDIPAFIKPVPARNVEFRFVKSNPEWFTNKLEQMLAKIGPDYHAPILKAARFYMMNAPVIDRTEFKAMVRDAIFEAIPGKNAKRDYEDDHYLDRVIGWASRFGRAL